MSFNIKLGTAKINITPSKPVPLAGFAVRKELGSFEGVSQPLFARLFLFEQEDQQGELQRALMVSADLLWWGSDRVPNLKQRINSRWGIEEQSIILHATHTHSGPQTSRNFTPSLGECKDEYLEQLENQLFEGIEQALCNVEPVNMERGQGFCGIGIHRRIKQGDLEAQMEPNPEGIVDHEIHVIKFVTAQEIPKAILVHYACHPVITRENLISSEFTGVAMELLESTLGGTAVAAFLQGCCGDINPSEDGQFCFGQDRDVQRLGRKFADDILAVLQRPMITVPAAPIHFHTQSILLPFRELPSLDKLESVKSESDVRGEWSRLLLASSQSLSPHAQFEITLLRIGEGLSFLAMNSEVVVEYGLFLKELYHNQILPIPYSNGMIGYMPTAKQLEDGGYEAKESTLYFGLPAPFDPKIETIIRAKLTRLMP